MSVWVVTGGTGFLGRHLLDALANGPAQGDAVWAVGRRCPLGWPAERFRHVDLDKPEHIARALAEIQPDYVLHAAGRTPPAPSRELYRANTRATVNLLEAAQEASRRMRIVLAGSAAELGAVPECELPAGEGLRCRPREPYGLSKWFATAAGLRAQPPVEVVAARIFNPIGPGMPPSQAFGRFAARLATPGPDPLALAVGDLDAKRDFIDIRDAAHALLALAQGGRAGHVYHVGTGHSRRVGEGLEQLIHLSGRAVIVERHPDAMRSQGPRDSRADISRILAHTGWEPAIAWEQSLADLWDEVRSRPLLPLTAHPVPV